MDARLGWRLTGFLRTPEPLFKPGFPRRQAPEQTLAASQNKWEKGSFKTYADKSRMAAVYHDSLMQMELAESPTKYVLSDVSAA